MTFDGQMYDKDRTFVVILAGGRGARFDHETQVLPKPLIEVAGKPILGHIMDLFEAQGFSNFIVLGGYLWEKLDEYLKTRYECSAEARIDIRVYGSNGKVPSAHLFNTGEDSTTGDRLMRLTWDMFPPPPPLGGERFFILTYGDGLCNVNINSLIETHIGNRFWLAQKMQPVVTVTAVHPPGRFGVLEFDEDPEDRNRIGAFLEKAEKEWINGGFMVVDHGTILRYVAKDPDEVSSGGPFQSFEEGALARLACDGLLFGYKHEDYWRCMDNRRDLEQIERDVKDNGGELPWLKTSDPG